MYYQCMHGQENELIFSKENETLFTMIPVCIDENDCVSIDKNSTQYVVVSKEQHKYFLKRVKEGNFSYSLEAIYCCDMKKFKKYTKEVFNKIAVDAEESGKKDYGVEDDFTYAYIMAHTKPEEHKFLRFYRWDKNNKSNGFTDLGDNWRQILQLPQEIKTDTPEYYRIPTCIGDLTDDKNPEWHIFSVIYKIYNQKTQLIMYHDNLNTNRKNNLPKDIEIKDLSTDKAYYLTTSTGNTTACAFATVEFFRKSNKEIEKFDIELKNKLSHNLKEIQEKAKNQSGSSNNNQNEITNKKGAGGLKLNRFKQKQNANNSKIISNLRHSFPKANKTSKALQGYQENYIKHYKNNIRYK